MKFLTYIFLGIALLVSQSSLVTAQEAGASAIKTGASVVLKAGAVAVKAGGAVAQQDWTATLSKSTVEFVKWADHIADLCNPVKLPVRYGKLLWTTGNAIYEGKENNSWWKMAGVLAIPVVPWLMWKIWIKKVWNKQCRRYERVRSSIQKHCTEITGPKPLANKNNFKNEMIKVKKTARKCRTLSTLFIKKDTVLIQLVDDFYANLGDVTEVGRLCGEITDYCAGIIKKYS